MAEKMVTVTKAMVRPFLREMARSDVEIGLEQWGGDDAIACFERALMLARAADCIDTGYPDSVLVEVPDGE